MKPLKIAGLVLLVVGAVLIIWGAYDLISFSASTGGRIANKVAGAFGSQTKVVRDSIIKIVIGAVSAGVGFVLSKKG